MNHVRFRLILSTLPAQALALATVMILLFSFIWIAPASASSTGTLTARVVLRKSADKESKALQTLPDGDDVDILNTSGDWYKVSYGSYTGYVMKKYVKVAKNSVAANSSKLAALGDAPGPLHVGDEGNDVKKLQKALKILGYYTLGIVGKYGEGTTVAVAMYQQIEKLEADGVAGKSTITAMFGSCAKNADIKVSGEDVENDDSADSSSDSTSSSSKSKSAASSTADDKSVTTLEDIGTAPSATKQGDSGTNVTKLQQALELLGYYSGKIDGSYGAKTVSAVKRFQKNRGMNEDGIAGASTLRVLFGSTASASKASGKSSDSSSSTDKDKDKSYKTITLDWFADDVSSLFPKKSHYVIKDVRTGKTFNGVRWSGVNHMDTEPATAEDTAIMKKIYGGAWSWSRRPILILFKGKVYAASMNGMPHGTSTIDNDFGGHFCIHFKNSKTHGTERVDPDHQKCVEIASKAKW